MKNLDIWKEKQSILIGCEFMPLLMGHPKHLLKTYKSNSETTYRKFRFMKGKRECSQSPGSRPRCSSCWGLCRFAPHKGEGGCRCHSPRWNGPDISAVFIFFVKFECLVQKSIFTFINGNRCDIQCQRIKCKLFTNYNIKVSSLNKTVNPSKVR